MKKPLSPPTAVLPIGPHEFFSDAQFRDLLTLNTEDGRLWLADRRMMLMDVASYTSIRKQLIDTTGVEQARRFLTTLGYHAGVADAELMQRRWPEDPLRRRSTSHPFLGVAQIELVSITTGSDGKETLEGEWIWQHCIEADAQIQAYGMGTIPACWMQAGYAIGFGTRSSGRLMLFEEVTCRAMGSSQCRVNSRPAERWSEIDRQEILRYLDVPLEPKLRSRRRSTVASEDGAAIVLAPQSSGAPRRTIVGRSPALKAAVELLNGVADTDATVLVTGESGVGKELFTQSLHALSKRAKGPFVAVNCAAIPDTLIETELFGVERGAFTGATNSRAGRFERAAGGTLFLDEIALLNHVSQAKLLRVLQEGEIERIGGTKSIKVDVRVVAATNMSLSAAVTENRFRDDLFFRLNVFPIHLPPLRERRDDIPELLQYYLKYYNERHGKSVPGFSRAARDALLQYRYPGNIRELENLVERAVILARDVPIDRSHLFSGGEIPNAHLLSLDARGKLTPGLEHARAIPATLSVKELLDEVAARMLADEKSESLRWPEVESQLVDALATGALAKSGGSVSAAARVLGIERHKLAYRLNKARHERG